MTLIEKTLIDPLCYFKEIHVGGVNIINPWGFETADSVSFFTLEWQGFRNEIIEDNVTILKDTAERDITVKMREGLWSLHIKEELSENTVVRNHRLTCLQDSHFMDFVARYRFKKQFVSKVLIAGRQLTFKNSNVYHQYEAQNVVLVSDEFNMLIQILETDTSGKFTPMMYARDSGDEWIVHCRMIPQKWDKEVIKLCVGWYNRAIPQWMSNILLSIFPLRSYLWYHGERKPYRFPLNKASPNAFPIVKLETGQQLYLRTSFSIER